MKKLMILKILGLAVLLIAAVPAVFAQCQSDIPLQLYLGESACLQICPGEVYPAIELIGNRPGEVNTPILLFESGCNPNTTHCEHPDCTPIEVPELVYNGNQYYPDQWYGINDCVEIFMYWGHDAIWWIEIWPVDCEGCFCLTFDSQLPVEMSTPFSAVAGDGEVALSWATASESGNDRFEIERGHELLTHIDGQGTSPTGKTYRFRDAAVENGVRYDYTLYAVDFGGHREAIGTAGATPVFSAGEVRDYALYQNYPNPFNPATSIGFDLVTADHVLLKVYNPIGEEIATLVNGPVNAGRHSVQFDGRNLTSGLYFYTVTIGDKFSATRKMLLVK